MRSWVAWQAEWVRGAAVVALNNWGTHRSPSIEPELTMGHFVYVVGARPNFVKMAPVIRAMEAIGCGEQYVVHTGQHYDRRLSQDIMEDLDFPRPDAFLNVGSGTHGEQIGQTLIAIEAVL